MQNLAGEDPSMTRVQFSNGSPKIAVIGAGNWGKNHVRNFYELGALAQICDADREKLSRMTNDFPGVSCTTSMDEILGNPEVYGVVLATPAASHYALAKRALESGKDVLVEKPLALDLGEAEALVSLATQKNSILMVGHILLYHPAVLKLKELVDSGYLGKLQYIESHRLSMGVVRNEENILWSFAPHDISVILYLLEEMPDRVIATGNCHLRQCIEDVTISVLNFPSGVGAHIYVSWMNPFKEQRLVVIGDKRMAVFEDSRNDQKLRVFNNNFNWVNRSPIPMKGVVEEITIENGEPLRQECQQFLESIRTRQKPRTDGQEGLRTLSVITKCYESMKQVRSSVPIPAKAQQEFFAHDTAEVEDSSSIGKGSQIWHFSHISKNVQIGKNCKIGQNVFIAKGVKMGESCKIQNNVSIYEGVTLEDHVFCGPSMVFTNVYNPRCEIPRMNEIKTTLVKRGATIGANATIVCGNTIGEYAFIGAGSVITKSVPDYALMVGNPARRTGWMCQCGVKLESNNGRQDGFLCSSCGKNYHLDNNAGLLLHEKNESIEGPIPLLDLKKQYESIKYQIESSIKKVVEKQTFINGPEVAEFENEMARYCGCEHAVGVSSGTDALLVSLMALGISRGDEVITTPFTFFATVGSILRVGATPVFADIDPETFNIDPRFVESRINSRTKAILPVHLFGQCADMNLLVNLAEQAGIPIIEDAAQAVGAEYKSKRAGSMGTVGCFSFFPSKNLGGFGDGGMITTNDAELAEKMRMIRNQGSKPKYYHPVIGGNFRLDTIQASILLTKLKHLDSWTDARIGNAAYYTGSLQQLGLADQKVIPPRILTERHVFNQYVIRTQERDGLKSFLKENGIATEIYYPKPMHLQQCINRNCYKEGDFPASEEASKQALALPVFPELTLEQKQRVINKINEYYQHH
jgi:UDP-2-acetamido-3-amino-2,3-dideoxy-glucuronate N-acetyltransferase